jgi:hypothetical protein
VNAEASERELIERALARPVSDATRAAWGFTNRTDMITLDNGQRVVLQRYRRREDAEYRLRAMRGLRTPAARAGIPLPRVRDYNLAVRAVAGLLEQYRRSASSRSPPRAVPAPEELCRRASTVSIA